MEDQPKRTLARDIFGDPIRKKRINSKQKGNANELKCAEAITMWTGEKFTRTPSSGGLRWQSSQGIAADLVCENPDFYFPLSTETKHLADFDDVKILAVWKQALADAVRAKKLPVLFLRRNGTRKFIYEGQECLNYFVFMDVLYGGAILNLKCLSYRTVHSKKRNQTLLGFMFSDLVKAIQYSRFADTIQKSDLIFKFLKQYGT